MESIRLNKYLSQEGVCSRREADRLISGGKVTIDGRQARVGDKVTGQETVLCNGVAVGPAAGGQKAKPVLLVVNKPRGVVCTTSHKDRAPNIVDMLQYPCRIYPVGRLDKDSEGLLLMTNQGELANQIMHGGSMHEKEYLVTVDRPLNPAFLKKMGEGVELKELGVTTRPCRVSMEGKKIFRIDTRDEPADPEDVPGIGVPGCGTQKGSYYEYPFGETECRWISQGNPTGVGRNNGKGTGEQECLTTEKRQ